MKIKLKEIEAAYRKFKHYFYFDNTNRLVKRKIARFEAKSNKGDVSLEKKLKALHEFLNQEDISLVNDLKDEDSYFSKLLKKIDYWILPKKIEGTPTNEIEKEESGILSNIEFGEDIRVSRLFYLINAPIEIHIISVLWIMKLGFNLENELTVQPAGNKLNIKNSGKGIINGLKLFKPYFIQYQNWRDRAIKKARQVILEDNENVAIIGLDVNDYYESIELDFKEVDASLAEVRDYSKYQVLTNMLERINIAYFQKRKKNDFADTNLGLPIGLLSSNVLSNWYLRDFDQKITDKINPVYYKRYVDDILIVISNPKHDRQNGAGLKKGMLEFYFEDNDILENDDGIFNIKGTPLKIQESKTSLMYFDCNEPITLLDKFEEEIRKNSSEFRLMPEEDTGLLNFHSAAHNLTYSGSKIKLRSIKDFSDDKFGASKFLAKKIFYSLQSDKLKDEETVSQINKFFKGRRAIEFNQLWSKVAIYFIVTNQQKGFYRFLKNLKDAMSLLSVTDEHAHEEIKLKNSLKEHLGISLCLALALNPKLETKRLKKLMKKTAKHENTFDFTIDETSQMLRESNMIRHNYIFFPLLNYTKFSTSKEISLVSKNISFTHENCKSLKINKRMIKFSPRFVHFHEVVLYQIRCKLAECESGLKQMESDITDDFLGNYLDDAFDLFFKLNYKHTGNVNKKRLKESYFKYGLTDSKYLKKEIIVEEGERKGKLKIALANIEVHHANMQQSYFKKPIISAKRKKDINRLFNQVFEVDKTEKIDALVLPETSIPFKWLNWISEHCRKTELLTVFGLEHWAVNNFAYNFIVTLLPVKVTTFEGANKSNFPAIIPIIRLKNDYSPSEVIELKGYRYNIPIPTEKNYDLIRWKGLRFSVINCFELANIHHRAAFRSRVDFLIACEFNKDVNYFSNIVEAVTRDVHCYFIQSNNSHYGDNRITRPSMTATKDQVRIKGGKNIAILVDTINVDSLRKFQLKGHNLQLKDKQFKPTPPGFDFKEVEKRMGLNLNTKK